MRTRTVRPAARQRPQPDAENFGGEVSFLNPPITSFDHLVCEQLDRVGHFEAERSGRYQIDDEFELGGLHDRQIGGPRALENSTRVDTYLTPRIQIIGPIAHQQARFDHLTAETTRRYPIARRERRELDAPAVEEPIAGNEKGIGAVAH